MPPLDYNLPKLEIGKAVVPPLDYNLPKLKIGRPTVPPLDYDLPKLEITNPTPYSEELKEADIEKDKPEKIEKKLSNTGYKTNSTTYTGMVGLILATIITYRKRKDK